MKLCPQCNRVETDEALKFCRVDGATLITDSGPVSGDGGTAKFGSAPVSSEIKTSILPHTTDASIVRRRRAETVDQFHLGSDLLVRLLARWETSRPVARHADE